MPNQSFANLPVGNQSAEGLATARANSRSQQGSWETINIQEADECVEAGLLERVGHDYRLSEAGKKLLQTNSIVAA